jgi:serine/threonine protein phosphatase PrpC
MDLQATCQRLIDEANASGGGDNITAILVRIS